MIVQVCGGDGLKWKFPVIIEKGCMVIIEFCIGLRANYGLLVVIGS